MVHLVAMSLQIDLSSFAVNVKGQDKQPRTNDNGKLPLSYAKTVGKSLEIYSGQYIPV